MSNLSMDPYESLANAIVLQAVMDYRDTTRKLAKGRVNHEAEKMKNDCLRFFRSPLFGVLTSIDPEMLIRKLDEEAGA